MSSSHDARHATIACLYEMHLLCQLSMKCFQDVRAAWGRFRRRPPEIRRCAARESWSSSVAKVFHCVSTRVTSSRKQSSALVNDAASFPFRSSRKMSPSAALGAGSPEHIVNEVWAEKPCAIRSLQVVVRSALGRYAYFRSHRSEVHCRAESISHARIKCAVVSVDLRSVAIDACNDNRLASWCAA